MHCMDRHHHWTPPRPTSHYDKPIAQGHRPPTTNHCQVRTCHPTTSHCQVLSIGWASLFTTRPATSGAPSSSECEMPTHHPSCEATHQPSCEATHQPSCEMATHHLLWSLIPYMATHHLLWSLIPCAPPRTWPATHHPAAAPMAIPREDYESQRARPGHCVAAERFLAQYDMLADPPLKLGERSYIPADPPLKLGGEATYQLIRQLISIGARRSGGRRGSGAAVGAPRSAAADSHVGHDPARGPGMPGGDRRSDGRRGSARAAGSRNGRHIVAAGRGRAHHNHGGRHSVVAA
eukprot:CAMPEP_0115888216 /NCGR_PEP_ID=MMETSP0287-20121206/32191_1 /TAXON_ID=412157 /ORGANISM="Chrysochromulina rotalis, Strain UIO044" /LENGTH=291 /DNA_ID=CAMNT_0003344889 /DNA_START=476 /DNA_END=1348 /DNA_ORIENTATION=-